MNVSIENPRFDHAARAEIEAIVAEAMCHLAYTLSLDRDIANAAMNIADQARARANLLRMGEAREAARHEEAKRERENKRAETGSAL